MSSFSHAFLSESLTAGYVPRVIGPAWSVNTQRPPFRLANVEQVRTDPQVQFGLRAIYAPLAGVKFEVRGDARVRGFVHEQLLAAWDRSLPQLVRYLDYGHLGGEWL